MKEKLLLSKLNTEITRFLENTDDDISNLSECKDISSKFKCKKIFAENIHKITMTLLQLKKLEQLGEDDDFDEKIDSNIIEKFLARKFKNNLKDKSQ